MNKPRPNQDHRDLTAAELEASQIAATAARTMMPECNSLALTPAAPKKPTSVGTFAMPRIGLSTQWIYRTRMLPLTSAEQISLAATTAPATIQTRAPASHFITSRLRRRPQNSIPPTAKGCVAGAHRVPTPANPSQISGVVGRSFHNANRDVTIAGPSIRLGR